MELQIFIKAGNSYEKRLIIPPSGAGREYFENLALTNKEQLEAISSDMMKFSNDDISINLKRPAHEDPSIQEKLNKLVEIRKINLNLREQIKSLLQEIEFIICDKCGCKSFKKPVGIPYKKLGNNYIFGVGYILKESENSNIKYYFSCENPTCVFSNEDCYIRMVARNRQIREELLVKGEDFVPTDFGYWYSNSYKYKEPWCCRL